MPELFGDSSELFGSDKHRLNRRVYTVSEITQDIKLILENTFSEVWVEGEVSNVRPSSAGHCYFSLKDGQALLPAVLFNRAASQVQFKIEDGLKVVCFGNIEVYPPHGKYQLIVEKIEPKGIGSLQLALEQLKAKLEKEGLFSPEHKRPIPYLPSRIGIVTSLSGAAIKDMLKVLDRRFRDIHIIINPVRVQGEGAGQEIAQAIRDFNIFNKSLRAQERIEVLIVGRGGGSIEDLWAFNEEVVARAIYHSEIPVISAVGHERDWTIADLVADLRAATPSVAAELVVPKKEDLRARVLELLSDATRATAQLIQDAKDILDDLTHRLYLSIDNITSRKEETLKNFLKNLVLLSPQNRIQQYIEKLAIFEQGMHLRIGHIVELRQSQYQSLVERLASLNPLAILSRGYSVTFRIKDNSLVKDPTILKIGEGLRTRCYKGEIKSTVTEVKGDGRDKI